jgi:cytoskeletal protein CcmA (bactofilin family)
MALFGNTRADDSASREDRMSERERSQFGSGGVDAFLGKGTKITGKLVFEGTARIEGQVDGEISAQEALTIGEGAVCAAKISGGTVVVEGRVNGDVAARQRLELRASGRVHGNVSTPSLVVHEGAILDGQCSMGGTETKKGADKTEALATQNLDRTRDAAIHVATALNR